MTSVDTTAPARPKRGVRSVPLAVWLIVALHLLVTLAQTAVFPNIRSPDELQHVDLIVQVHEGEAWPWPAPGEARISAGTYAGAFLRADGLPGPRHLADRDVIPPRGERTSYDAAGGTETRTFVVDGEEVSRVNQLIQHPPLYYLFGAAVLHLVPDWQSLPFDQVWLLLRWWNALLTAAIPLLMWAIARRLRLPDPLPVAAALIPVAIPEMTHLDSAVNNDNLLIVLGTAATLLVARVLTGDLSRRTALGIGALITLMMLTKGFGLMMPAVVALAYAVAGLRQQQKARAFAALVVAGLASVPGAAWWIRNLVVYGRVQPNGYSLDSQHRPAIYGWDDGGAEWLGRLLERFVTLFFVQDHAGLQRQDASWWMARVAVTLVLVGLLVTLVRRTLPRSYLPVLILPVVALGAIVAMGSWETFAATQNTRAAQQGRYLYTGMAALMVAALAGAAALPSRLRRLVPLGMLVLAGAMHAAFHYDAWWLYWFPREGTLWAKLLAAAETMAHWYPFPPAVLGTVVVATVVSALAVLVATARIAVARPPYTAVVSSEPHPLETPPAGHAAGRPAEPHPDEPARGGP